jgi:hypothetical protein
VRDAYRRLVEQGWTDALRALHPGARIYTFWKYFRNAFARDAGLRIDNLLLACSARWWGLDPTALVVARSLLPPHPAFRPLVVPGRCRAVPGCYHAAVAGEFRHPKVIARVITMQNPTEPHPACPGHSGGDQLPAPQTAARLRRADDRAKAFRS